MKGWTSEKRVLTTFNHEEPDRIPIYEGSIEVPELVQSSHSIAIKPGIMFLSYETLKFFTSTWFQPLRKSFFKILKNPILLQPLVKSAFNRSTQLHRTLGIDLMGYTSGIPMIFSDKLFSDFSINKRNRTIQGLNGKLVLELPSSDSGGAVQRNGFLSGPEDYERYMEFNPDHPGNYFLTKKTLAIVKGKIALLFSVTGAAFFETMAEMFGFVTLFKFLVKNKNFVKRVVQDLSDYACSVAEQLIEKGVQFFYMTDDLGLKAKGMISPRMYENFFHDKVKKFAKIVHDGGGYIFRHSCGYFKEYIPFFIKEGMDGVHPWESSAGMDIFEAKQNWGDNFTLIGNVPIGLLSHGTVQQVVDYCKTLIHLCGPEGGYIGSSSHSIVPSVKWQNYAAMLWIFKKYGKYPIIN